MPQQSELAARAAFVFKRRAPLRIVNMLSMPSNIFRIAHQLLAAFRLRPGRYRLTICALIFVQIANVRAAVKFETVRFGQGSNTCHIFIPDNKEESSTAVLFLHGHGASNALVYGGWINQFLREGKVVIFPKYQTGWFIPVVSWSKNRSERALLQALEQLQCRKISITRLHIVGHSLGGSIGANIAATTVFPTGVKLASVALIEPGAMYFKSGRLRTYNTIPSDVRLFCITASADIVAGRRFARYVMEHSPQLREKLHLEIAEQKIGVAEIRARHFDPASIDKSFDTHNRNLIIRGAKWICDTDVIDSSGFWEPVAALQNGNITFPPGSRARQLSQFQLLQIIHYPD